VFQNVILYWGNINSTGGPNQAMDIQTLILILAVMMQKHSFG